MMEDSLLKGSVAFLRPSTVECLGVQLNPVKHLLSRGHDKKRLRDWRGVYEETCLVSDRFACEKIKQASNHFKQFLEQWKHYDEASVDRLFEILESMDRFDVIDDNKHKILEDMKVADNLLKVKGLSLAAVENKIAGSEQVLTYDDIAMLKKSSQVAKYDVLILHADEDSKFASEMAQVLEQQRIKVCLKDRDLLVGTTELAAVTSLVSERCNKVAVLLTPEFFSSTSNKFYSVLAQCRAITENKRSFLPIVHNNQTDLPTNISMLTKLSTSNPYFWKKLCLNINESFEESVDNPLPSRSSNTELKENTRKAITNPQQQSMQNNSQLRNQISSHSNPLYNINNHKNFEDKQTSKNPGTSAVTSPTSSSSSSSSIKKLFKSFGADMRNKLTKKSKSGHQLFKNEPEFSGVEDLSSSDQIRMVDNAPAPPSQEPRKSGGIRSKQKEDAYQVLTS